MTFSNRGPRRYLLSERTQPKEAELNLFSSKQRRLAVHNALLWAQPRDECEPAQKMAFIVPKIVTFSCKDQLFVTLIVKNITFNKLSIVHVLLVLPGPNSGHFVVCSFLQTPYGLCLFKPKGTVTLHVRWITQVSSLKSISSNLETSNRKCSIAPKILVDSITIYSTFLLFHNKAEI